MDSIMNPVCALCRDYEQAGFVHGVQVGMLLAKELKTASPKPQQTENPKFAMRTWLIRLGLVGEEFSTARSFLTKNLDGDAAFRYGRA